MRKCINSDAVCDFLTDQAAKYNLNVVTHWIVKNEDIYEVFYVSYED